MNKPIISLLAILVSILSCSKDVDKTPSKTLVESRMLKYKYTFGKLDSTGVLHERILFDIKGRDSIIEKHDDDGLLFISTIIYYDSIGNRIKDIDYKPNGSVESKTEYKYSNKGYILERNSEQVDGGYNHYKYLYDNEGKIIKEIRSSKWYFDFLDKWVTSNYTTIRIYDNNGFCIGEKESEDGKPFKDVKSKFDSVGNEIYTDLGSNIRKSSYDKNGNIIEHLSLDENEKLVWRWVSKYDSNNVLIEYKTYNSLNEPVEVLRKEFIYK